MENSIQLFKSPEFGDLETLEVDGQIYFRATQVATILGYQQPEKAVRDHCDSEGCLKWTVPTKGGNQEAKFISEGNLYRLILHSKLKSVKRFEKWVCDEILPTIRKTGSYSITQESVKHEEPLNVRALKSAGECSMVLIKDFEIDAGIARACALNMAEEAYGVDLKAVKKLLPTVGGRLLNPTMIAIHFGLRNSRVVNKWLKYCGLQTYMRGVWVPTAEGKEFSTYQPYENNVSKHKGRQLMWEEDYIIPFLEKHPCPEWISD